MTLEIRRQLNNLTECSVCKDTFIDPRILPCVHTYCLKCIKGFSGDKQPGDHVTCPICRNEFVLPGSGVESLQKNFFIEQLKDLSDPSNKHCGECCDDKTDTALKKQAVMYCIDCQQRFCELCVEVHKKAKVSRRHKLIESGDNENMQAAVTKNKTIPCNIHQDRDTEVYCTVCREAICMKCLVALHQSHKCIDVNKVVDELRQKMTNDIKKMNETIEKCHDALKEQKKNTDNFSKTVQEIEKEIYNQAKRWKKMIDAEKRNLLQELASRKADRMKEIQHATENIEQYMSIVDSLIKYTEELRDRGSAAGVAQQEKALHDRADELMKTVVNREIAKLGCIEASFEAVKWSAGAAKCQIGRIIWHQIEAVQPTASSTTMLTHVIEAGDRSDVVGVTSIDDRRIYLLLSPSQQRIHMYDLKKSIFQQQTLQVSGLSDSYDNGLTACVLTKFLYVSDCETDTVYKVKLASYSNISKWSVGRGPRGLSINIAWNLLVACNKDNKIQEYHTTSRSLVREICLVSLSATHVIQLTSGHFLVSYVNSSVSDVVEVDANGRVVVRYTSQLQSTTQHKFSKPRHLAVDKNNKCILVADPGTNRIVILNRSLNSCAREFNMMSVDGGLPTPWCLHFDESRGRLFVGEFGCGKRRVSVFDNVINIANCFH